MRFLMTSALLVLLIGCAGVKKLEHPSISKLQGIWEGEIVEKDGTLKKWRQIRNSEGEFITFFGYKYPSGEVNEFIDTGKWWDENERFHEINPKKAEKPDIYTYEFYKSDCVRFVQVSRGGKEPGSEPYTFTECKVGDAPKVDRTARQT